MRDPSPAALRSVSTKPLQPQSCACLIQGFDDHFDGILGRVSSHLTRMLIELPTAPTFVSNGHLMVESRMVLSELARLVIECGIEPLAGENWRLLILPSIEPASPQLGLRSVQDDPIAARHVLPAGELQMGPFVWGEVVEVAGSMTGLWRERAGMIRGLEATPGMIEEIERVARSVGSAENGRNDDLKKALLVVVPFPYPIALKAR